MNWRSNISKLAICTYNGVINGYINDTGYEDTKIHCYIAKYIDAIKYSFLHLNFIFNSCRTSSTACCIITLTS